MVSNVSNVKGLMQSASRFTSASSSSTPKQEHPSNETERSNVVINNLSFKKANMKDVFIGDSVLSALIDTGSDLNILSWDEYQKLDAPELKKKS